MPGEGEKTTKATRKRKSPCKPQMEAVVKKSADGKIDSEVLQEIRGKVDPEESQVGPN